MSEIVFPCNCGMNLKVYGDDQVGQGIVCPSCGSTVIVPAVGIDFRAPASRGPDSTAAVPAAATAGKWLGLAYMAAIGVVTMGLIKFVLMPALAAPPVTVAQRDVAKTAEPKDTPKTATTDSGSDDAPRHLVKRPGGHASKVTPKVADDTDDTAPKKRSRPSPPIASAEPKPRPASSPSRKPTRTMPASPSADDPAETPDEPETPPRPKPVGPLGPLDAGTLGELADELRDRLPPEAFALEEGLRRGLGGLIPIPRPGTTPGRGFGGVPSRPGSGVPPRGSMPSRTKRSLPPKSSPPPEGADSKPDDDAKTPPPKDEAKTAKKSGAKKSPYDHIANKEVRTALEYAARNTNDILATPAAESFLSIAEKAGGSDPAVKAEIEKLRHKIAKIRNEE